MSSIKQKPPKRNSYLEIRVTHDGSDHVMVETTGTGAMRLDKRMLRRVLIALLGLLALNVPWAAELVEALF